MNCPVCKEPMFVAEHDKVEIDCCPSCEGIWLDAGELELLLGGSKQGASFLGGGVPAGRTGEKPRRCPICRKKMSKASTQGEHAVIYDVCPRGDGLWLDKGELERVVADGVAHEGGKEVTAHLRRIFTDDAHTGPVG